MAKHHFAVAITPAQGSLWAIFWMYWSGWRVAGLQRMTNLAHLMIRVAGDLLEQVEAGIIWPTPGSNFWEQPTRKVPLPLAPPASLAGGKRDSRQLHVVHVTAEMAPIAKVGLWHRSGLSPGSAGHLSLAFNPQFSLKM